MITESTIYWITRLDHVKVVLGIAPGIGFLALWLMVVVLGILDMADMLEVTRGTIKKSVVVGFGIVQ